MVAITASSANGGAHTLPGRNGAIAFARRDGLYLIRPDGSNLRRIVAGKLISGPSWSPDGRRIVYSCRYSICVVGSNGRGKLRLVGRRICSPKGDVTRDYFPAWAPDGKQIAFEQHCGKTDENPDRMALESVDKAPAGFCQGAFYGICVMNTRGRHLRKLITNATDLTWSPDGRKITFFRGSIFVATARGSGKQRIAPGAFHRVDWSPDGRLIAYSHETFSEDPPLSAIYVVPVAGGQPTELTTEREPETVASPAFSPDGNSIVFETGDTPGPSGAGLWIVGANGTGARRLTGPGRDPAWQRFAR